MAALVWLLFGLFTLIVGAELIVRGGARIASRLGVPPIVIGLTIVSIGTSAPELAVGIEAALRGNGALAVGNIAGTNTVNLLLILGLSALLNPLAIGMQTLRFDLPLMSLVALALWLLVLDGNLSRTEGLAMVAAGVVYTVAVIRWSKRESLATKKEFAREYSTRGRSTVRIDTAWSCAALIVGIVVIVIGSDLLVDGATSLARSMGVSDAFIGLTIIAIGTSSPELVTTVVGTLRNDRDIAIGNLLGSSIYNVLFILGVTCLVPEQPLPVESQLIWIDVPVMMVATLACIPVFLSGKQVSRAEGGLFVAAYCLYLLYLIDVRTHY